MKITIPAKYRHKLGNKVAATRGMDGCIFLFTEKYLESLISRLENSEFGYFNDTTGKSVASMIAGGARINMNQDGAITIPEYIRDYAKLKKAKNTVFVDAHSMDHWSRVKELGSYSVSHTRADRHVVVIFSLIHDSKRGIEYYDDPEHGLEPQNTP